MSEDITAAERESLLVPLAVLPGLSAYGLDVIVMPVGHERLVTNDSGSGDAVWVLADIPRSVRRTSALLDLADAATRDRVARWCAMRLGWTFRDCTAPSWDRTWDVDAAGEVTDARGWYLVAGDAQHVFITARGPSGEGDLVLAALDGIDQPDDDRRLSDGSRWCDAAALAVLARHLGAGGAR